MKVFSRSRNVPVDKAQRLAGHASGSSEYLNEVFVKPRNGRGFRIDIMAQSLGIYVHLGVTG
jgi:hypothetical protein